MYVVCCWQLAGRPKLSVEVHICRFSSWTILAVQYEPHCLDLVWKHFTYGLVEVRSHCLGPITMQQPSSLSVWSFSFNVILFWLWHVKLMGISTRLVLLITFFTVIMVVILDILGLVLLVEDFSAVITGAWTILGSSGGLRLSCSTVL